MKRVIILCLALAACGSTQATSSPPTASAAASSTPAGSIPATTAPAAATTAQVDPWEAFLADAKAQGVEVSPTMTRDDALARALLGCGITYPPKTVDALLAQAYKVQIEQAKAQGHCK